MTPAIGDIERKVVSLQTGVGPSATEQGSYERRYAYHGLFSRPLEDPTLHATIAIRTNRSQSFSPLGKDNRWAAATAALAAVASFRSKRCPNWLHEARLRSAWA